MERSYGSQIKALEENQTWELVPKPQNTSILGIKWVYSIKLNSNGSLDRYKARLIAQGTSKTIEYTTKKLLIL